MKIQSTPQINPNVRFTGNWLIKFDQALGKLIQPKPVLTVKNMELVDRVETIARKQYNPIAAQPVKLSVKNGNKEFSFLYKNSSWHRVNVTKKGEPLYDFEILHVKGDSEYDFYSTGGYPSRIIDKKFIDKYNGTLEEWMPRLIKRCEQLEKRGSATSGNNV